MPLIRRCDEVQRGDVLRTDDQDADAQVVISRAAGRGVVAIPLRGGEPEPGWVIQCQLIGGRSNGRRFAEMYAPSDRVRYA